MTFKNRAPIAHRQARNLATACIGLMAICLAAEPVFADEPGKRGSRGNSQVAENTQQQTPRIEYQLDDLVRRLDFQDQRIAVLEDTIARQNYELATQRARQEADRTEITRLRLALADQGDWDTIDRRTAQPSAGGGRSPYYQTAQMTVPAQDEQDAQGQPGSAGAPAPNDDPAMASAERPQSDKATDQLLLDQGGVLLPAGVFQLEPSIDYTSISNDRVNVSGFSIFNAILIGTIRVDDVSRDIITGALTARYGFGHRTQLDVRVPYVYRNDTETTGIGTGDAQERRITGDGLGDISATFAWQPFSARGWRPATILRLQAEFPTGKSAFEIERIAPEENSPERILVAAPTGSGFTTISPGVTFVWPIDPVVLFAGGAYNYSLGRTFEDFGEIEPGHGFEFFAGMNMSINESVSMNFSFLDKQRFATTANGLKLPGSGTHDARLSLGASVGLTDRLSLVMSTAAGLTDESPDFSFSVRIPYVF